MDLNACGVMENMNQKESEEWVDRVADKVEEKRLQNTQGSTQGISYLTTRNVYD